MIVEIGGAIRRVNESRERPQEKQNPASLLATADPHLGQKLAIESCAAAPVENRSASQMLARCPVFARLVVPGAEATRVEPA